MKKIGKFGSWGFFCLFFFGKTKVCWTWLLGVTRLWLLFYKITSKSDPNDFLSYCPSHYKLLWKILLFYCLKLFIMEIFKHTKVEQLYNGFSLSVSALQQLTTCAVFLHLSLSSSKSKPQMSSYFSSLNNSVCISTW